MYTITRWCPDQLVPDLGVAGVTRRIRLSKSTVSESCIAKIHSIADLVLSSPIDIAKGSRITMNHAQAILDDTCRELASEPMRLDSKSLPTTQAFTTGDEILDAMVGDGVRSGMVWEFVGER